jgi:hypothetical protein
MGVGTPLDILEGISAGVDMFDCVLPTRNARNGTLYTSQGKVNIRRAEYREDDSPLDPLCPCYACRTFSKAYLRHLYVAQELLSYRLNSLHNITFFLTLARQAREAIEQGRFAALKAHYQDVFAPAKTAASHDPRGAGLAFPHMGRGQPAGAGPVRRAHALRRVVAARARCARPADAIVIMGGDARRSAHGADLYLAGYARPCTWPGRSTTRRNPCASWACPVPGRRRWSRPCSPSRACRARPRAYTGASFEHVEEAEALARALPPEARTILVVTSPSHCRRALAVLRHELPGRTILMSPTPHERFEPKWWTHQASAKAVVLELAKFAQYYVGKPFRTGVSMRPDAGGRDDTVRDAAGGGGQDAPEDAGKYGTDTTSPRGEPARTAKPPQAGADGSRGAQSL